MVSSRSVPNGNFWTALGCTPGRNVFCFFHGGLEVLLNPSVFSSGDHCQPWCSAYHGDQLPSVGGGGPDSQSNRWRLWRLQAGSVGSLGWSPGQSAKRMRPWGVRVTRTCTAWFPFFRWKLRPLKKSRALFMRHGGTDLNVCKELKTVDFNSSSLSLPPAWKVNISKGDGWEGVPSCLPSRPRAVILEDHSHFTHLSPFLLLFLGMVGTQHVNLIN